MKQKKLVFALILLILPVMFGGCSRQSGDTQHPDWAKDWFRMGDRLAVSPLSGFELNESNDVLSIAGLYYATWTSGEGRQITNPQGQEATVYDVQIYLLLKQDDSESAVRADIADWTKRESESYETGAEKTLSVSGQEFTVLPLLAARSGNPYAGGLAAFGARGTDAISVEVLYSERFSGNPETVLTDFLNCLHY